MASYRVLYTHQKAKKFKSWQDGFLRVTEGAKKAVLLDESKAVISSVPLTNAKISAGDELESCRYLIMVDEEEEKVDQLKEQNAIMSNPVHKKTFQAPRRAGLSKQRAFSAPYQVVRPNDPPFVEKSAGVVSPLERPATVNVPLAEHSTVCSEQDVRCKLFPNEVGKTMHDEQEVTEERMPSFDHFPHHKRAKRSSEAIIALLTGRLKGGNASVAATSL